MVLNDYRAMLARIRRVFETSLEERVTRAGYGPATAAPITPAIQPQRRAAPRRDGTNPWGIESRRNY
jgi:hypothetical protein